MYDRLSARRRDSGSLDYVLLEVSNTSVGQHPGLVLDIGVGEACSDHTVKAKPRGQKNFQMILGYGFTDLDFNTGAGRAERLSSLARVCDGLRIRVDAHIGPSIWESVQQASSQDSRQAIRFQSEEPYARLAVGPTNVGADVRFRKP